MLPITGPYSKTIEYYGPPNMYGTRPIHLSVRRDWHRQAKPYNLPLTYTLDKRFIENFSSQHPALLRDISNVDVAVDQNVKDAIYAKCYAKFRDALLQEQAQMSVNLAERQQALDMMASRIMQLVKFAKSVRKGNFANAAQALGIRQDLTRPGRKIRTKAKDFGNTWLEYHFGWEPLVKDIGSCMELLVTPLPPIIISARSGELRQRSFTRGSGTSLELVNEVLSVKQQMVAQVRVQNPNLRLLDQLGFVNPAVVAWELVPFSFVVDWFVNVGDFLGSFTDFWGESLVAGTFYQTFYFKKWQRVAQPTPGQNTKFDGTRVLLMRGTGLPTGPALHIRPLKRLSWERGLTAASLLVKHLR